MPRQEVVELDGVKYPCFMWDVAFFKRAFIDGRKEAQPEDTDDWKAIIWLYDGPKPSQIEKVIIKPTHDFRKIIMAWELKNGLLTKQASD